MGDPKKPRKKWRGPRHPWRKDVLEQELELMGKYGLRNKRELWIAKTMLSEIRRKARVLLALPEEERRRREKALVHRLYRMGILNNPEGTVDDILNLTVEDILERRLQTIVYKKGLARTIYQARQFIVHGHIAIGERRVTSPGYLVSREEEPLVDYAPTSPIKEKAKQIVGG
ncbi:MAG: 30S ribosomal protein S4 [Thermoprotei archaeon]|nr:MAG: 30S ribosomal protein S4 [Thermoprotei archaeon]RLF24288.1 MAG: 30S ribosomal protein S4 [Thermoprotei archaeon]